ncbi:MAG: hypothetical protein E6J03_11670 [Chloroflexi bacterium]|nr:MAG: hypothetical protein E6J03_11670 [Chloroflexota bacterium]
MIALSLPADLPSFGGFSVGSLLLSVIAGLAVMLVVFGLASGRGEVDDITRRLERYADLNEPGEAREKKPLTPRELLDRITDSLNTLMARSSKTGKLTEDLARADLKLKSSEWVLGVVGAGVLIGLLAALRFSTPLAFLPCPVATWFISGFVLRFLQARRKRAFDKQLGDTIILLSNALKAGYSFAQAVSTVSKTASPPIADEFSRATREMALGIRRSSTPSPTPSASGCASRARSAA